MCIRLGLGGLLLALVAGCAGSEEPGATDRAPAVAGRPAVVMLTSGGQRDEATSAAPTPTALLKPPPGVGDLHAALAAHVRPIPTASVARSAVESGGLSRPGPVRRLAVPYRSQLDGNPYAESDCGPASMAMALGYHGRNVPTRDLRALVNDLQGTHGMYDAGSTIESLAAIAQRHGLRALDLQNGSKLRRWTIDDVRRHLEAGNPIVPQVWYRGLPGRESRSYQGDHYVVLVGYDGDEVLYHDPIDKDGPGAFRRMTPAQLDKAWRNSDFPYAALAVGRP